VIISGDGNFQGKERALSEGAAQYLEKPFDISLVGRIAESIFLEFPRKRKHPRYLCSIPLRLSILAPSPEEAQFSLDSLGGTINDVGPRGSCEHGVPPAGRPGRPLAGRRRKAIHFRR